MDIKISPKDISKFIDAMNHRMTHIENDVIWIKRIVWYLAGVISVGVGKLIIFGGG